MLFTSLKVNNVHLLRDSEPIRLLETPRSLSVIEYKGFSITLRHFVFAILKSCRFPVMHSPHDAYSSNVFSFLSARRPQF